VEEVLSPADPLCPQCLGALGDSDECASCAAVFPRADGMRFLLPAPMMHIAQSYDEDLAHRVSAEQL
jgi:hypothetical protein